MEIGKPEAIKYLYRPLCCRYLFVHFKTLSLQAPSEGPGRNCTVHWAYGALADGRSEVLGAWLNSDLGSEGWRAVFDSLKTRGVEGIRFLFSGEQVGLHSALGAAFPSTKVLPSVEPLVRQTHALLGSGAGELALDRRGLLADGSETQPRLRRVIQHCDAAVQQLHGGLMRALVRRPCFADHEAAASLVVTLLEHAESRLVAIGAKPDLAMRRAARSSTRPMLRSGPSRASPLPG